MLCQASAPQCCAMARQVWASCTPHCPCRPVWPTEHTLPSSSELICERQTSNVCGVSPPKWADWQLANIAGSGKTYTLLGAPGSFEQRGLAARTVYEVFKPLLKSILT